MLQGKCTSGKPRSGPASYHRYVIGVAELKDRLDLINLIWKHYKQRHNTISRQTITFIRS
ncbi:hypothetical protein D3C73_1449220 [compost metagenome]